MPIGFPLNSTCKSRFSRGLRILGAKPIAKQGTTENCRTILHDSDIHDGTSQKRQILLSCTEPMDVRLTSITKDSEKRNHPYLITEAPGEYVGSFMYIDSSCLLGLLISGKDTATSTCFFSEHLSSGAKELLQCCSRSTPHDCLVEGLGGRKIVHLATRVSPSRRCSAPLETSQPRC